MTRGVRGSGPKVCIVPDCERTDIAAFALCWAHYKRMKRHGVVGGAVGVRVNDGPCSVNGCDNHARVRGLCSKHYERWLKHGDPLHERVYRPHGHITRYVAGCRCDECREANRAYQRRGRAIRTTLLAADPTLAEHGCESTYGNWGCRCDDCKAAHSEKMRSPEHRASAARSRAKRVAS